ncbi:MAG TPA: aminodeoxychorismate synthase component I [Steroidobacteraceae bacterium]|nr:aminodeoxychorismate synthase component I [Steroidobacteraceae bacterium]
MAPTVRSFSADLEPLTLIEKFPAAYPGLLESGAGTAAAGSGSRFDILPMASGECLRLGSDARLSGPHAGTHGFLGALENWWSALRTAEVGSPLPFTGGWLLYLGYELAAEIEPRLQLPQSTDPVIALAIRAPAAWIRDRATGQAWLVAEPGYEALLDEFEARAQGQGEPPSVRGAVFKIDEDEPEAFMGAVRRALEYIAAGDVYQANLSRGWQGRATPQVDPVRIYQRLRATNPSPFAALLQYRDFALLSSSPERLVSVRAGTVSTRPIAGTRPRGATPEADAALVQSLLANEKERAEHVMLIDLERNDLGRVCAGGSVRVDEYMSVETYAHVHHIVSNVSGRLRADVSPIGVIRALFPGGTITGCPKVRCMEIIAELEGVGRGAYTGSIGYLNRDGSCDLNILIRTITAQGGLFKFRAGAGIVADSNPAQELAETRAKAEGLLRALAAPP